MRKNKTTMKIDVDDLDIIKKIAAKRYSSNLDKKQLTPARLMKATLRIPKVKDVLLKSRIEGE